MTDFTRPESWVQHAPQIKEETKPLTIEIPEPDEDGCNFACPLYQVKYCPYSQLTPQKPGPGCPWHKENENE